jgi:hypothetical protein
MTIVLILSRRLVVAADRTSSLGDAPKGHVTGGTLETWVDHTPCSMVLAVVDRGEAALTISHACPSWHLCHQMRPQSY